MASARGVMARGSSGSVLSSLSPQMYTLPSGRGYTSGSFRCPAFAAERMSSQVTSSQRMSSQPPVASALAGVVGRQALCMPELETRQVTDSFVRIHFHCSQPLLNLGPDSA